MDVLFRVAIAILRINEAEFLACDSVSSLYIQLESVTSRMWHPDKLLKVRYSMGTARFLWHQLQVESELKSCVTHNELVKRREAHVAALKEVL